MKPRTLILAICLFGFFIRALFIIGFNSDLLYPDEERFWEEAMMLLEHGSLESNDEYAHDMPLTALVIAATVALTGCGVVGVKLLFAAISAATIYLIGRLATCLCSARYAGVLAAAIAAIYPFFIYYSSLVMSETIFLFLLVLSFLSVFTLTDRKYTLTGLILGFAHLTRPTLMFFLPFIWGWSVVFGAVKWRYVAGSVLVLLLTILPWGIRNYHTLGSFHLTTSGGGHVLWEGNNPFNTTGGVSGDFKHKGDYLAELPPGLGELETDEWEKQQAVAFIKENPDHFAAVAIKKFVRFWNFWPNTSLFASWQYKLISVASFAPVLILFLLSPVYLWRERNKLGLLLLFALYLTALHMVTIGSIRYRLPLEPLMIAIAGGTLAKILPGPRHE